MKILDCKISDENLRDEVLDKAFEMIRSGKYAEAYELRDIVVCKWNGKGKDDYGFSISVEDSVEASFSINHYMLGGSGEDADIMTIESELFADELIVPRTAEVKLDWKEDVPNQYKTVKLHFDEIKGMAQKGISPKEIAKTFEIPWTNEDSLWIMAKDKI